MSQYIRGSPSCIMSQAGPFFTHSKHQRYSRDRKTGSSFALRTEVAEIVVKSWVDFLKTFKLLVDTNNERSSPLSCLLQEAVLWKNKMKLSLLQHCFAFLRDPLFSSCRSLTLGTVYAQRWVDDCRLGWSGFEIVLDRPVQATVGMRNRKKENARY